MHISQHPKTLDIFSLRRQKPEILGKVQFECSTKLQSRFFGWKTTKHQEEKTPYWLPGYHAETKTKQPFLLLFHPSRLKGRQGAVEEVEVVKVTF